MLVDEGDDEENGFCVEISAVLVIVVHFVFMLNLICFYRKVISCPLSWQDYP